MDVDPRYKYIEKFRRGIEWYIMESKDLFQLLVSNYKKNWN